LKIESPNVPVIIALNAGRQGLLADDSRNTGCKTVIEKVFPQAEIQVHIAHWTKPGMRTHDTGLAAVVTAEKRPSQSTGSAYSLFHTREEASS